MHGEHPHSQQVGLTQVVDEAADVAKESRINAMHVSHLHKMMNKESRSHVLHLEGKQSESTRKVIIIHEDINALSC